MALATATTAAPARASWDTQQRLPYNRNAPRKITPPKTLSLSPIQKQSSSTVDSIQSNPRLQIDVDALLKFDAASPKSDVVDVEETTYLGYERWLPSPPKVEKPRSSYNAAALAYIGDSIYELYARRHFLAPTLNIEEYNDRVMAVVRCEAQDALLQKLLSEDFLSKEERDVLRWGKNVASAKTRTRRRAGAAVYNRASSLETLIGYLYLTNPVRLEDIMSRLGFSVGVSNHSILEDLNKDLQNMKQTKQTSKILSPV